MDAVSEEPGVAWRIVQRTYVRRGRTVVRWALQRGYRRRLERWSPRSPARRWRMTAERLYRTEAAARKGLAAAIAAEAVTAETQP